MKLVLEQIAKSFGNKQVLRDISGTFEQGNIYGLLGRNGAGKTTLFNCLSDEIQPDAGTATLLLEDGSSRSLASKDISYALSTPILPDFLTGREFIKFFIDVNADAVDASKSVDDYFDLVQIDSDDRDRLIRGYSHGMKNKVQMLCSIIARPPVILLDEPLTSFDVVVALEIKQILKQMKQDHILVFSTHILQLATDLCDQIVVLHEGTLEFLSHETLKQPDFEQRIVQLLTQGEQDD
ncbi:ABC transporter ATP-binding protein [Eubacteriales bacterium OttesenSCG-928-N14]|nr:ABC transporter ATP-binding protein [Eubacteriales bacterium OttesenSCG-928-N14]